MRKAVGLFIVAMFVFMQAGTVWAAVRSFTLTASVPTATGVSINAASVDATTGTFTNLASTATTLSFDIMTYNSTYGFWSPDHYFAVDVGTTGGSGSLTTVVTYTEGANPNSGTARNGLGYKGKATFMKVTGTGTETTETAIAAHGIKKFVDLTGTTVTPAQVTGGWLRVYLGIATGATGEPTGAEMFTNLDAPGTYDGTITFSATVS